MNPSPCEVWFYHLERASLDQVLPDLLEKTLARGWRALVRCSDPVRVDQLDDWLWSYRDDSFLPHGVAGEAAAARQPVLLSLDNENANAADVMFLLDDSEPGDISSFARCILIFDGHDEAAVAAARRRWKGFSDAGLSVAYWRQSESRGWQKQG